MHENPFRLEKLLSTLEGVPYHSLVFHALLHITHQIQNIVYLGRVSISLTSLPYTLAYHSPNIKHDQTLERFPYHSLVREVSISLISLPCNLAYHSNMIKLKRGLEPHMFKHYMFKR